MAPSQKALFAKEAPWNAKAFCVLRLFRLSCLQPRRHCKCQDCWMSHHWLQGLRENSHAEHRDTGDHPCSGQNKRLRNGNTLHSALNYQKCMAITAQHQHKPVAICHHKLRCIRQTPLSHELRPANELQRQRKRMQ